MLKVLLIYLICTQKCNAQFFSDVGHFFSHTVYHLIIPVSRYTTPRPDVKVVYFELEQLQPHVVESFLDGCHDGAVYTTFRENTLLNVGERTCYWCVCVYRDYAKCWARTTERCRDIKKYYSHVLPDEHKHYANRLRIRRSKSGQIIKYSQDIPQTIHIREAPSPASPNCTNTSKPYDVKKGHGEKCSHHLSCECVKDTWSCSTLKLCYEDAPEGSDLEPVKRLDEVINSLKGNNFYLNGTFEDINQYVLEHVDNWFNFNKSNSIVAEVLKDTDANPFDK